MSISIPGLEDHEIAHLSAKQRQKLADERSAGKDAAEAHKAAREHNERVQDRLRQNDADREQLDAEQIIARRTAERKLAEQRATEQQEVNARVNAEKEAADQNENIHGKPAVSEHVAEAAADLVQQRAQQAREIGLTSDSTFVGHPDATEGQEAAALANAAKEISDREQANNYDASGAYQGATENKNVGIKLAEFDDDGNLIEDQETAERTGADNNGQADQTSEPSAAELALEGITGAAPARTRRNRPAASPAKAVGDGPTSE